ncbi:MAG: hypothetical protein QM639_05825 [Rhodocyclaceae bacterium]
MIRIASATPGRVRLKAPALAEVSLLDSVVRQLTALAGVRTVRVNAHACSVVVAYDDTLIDANGIAAFVCGLIGTPPAPPRGGKTMRLRANRYAKYGAMASLAASMAFAAAGNKRWHIATGGVFLAFLGVHMAVHRRHLLR